MKKEQFKNWLKNAGIGSHGNYTSRLSSMENIYGDIDNYYAKDKCVSLLKEFEYSHDDIKLKNYPHHKMPIENKSGKNEFESFYEGTKDYYSRLKKYVEFHNEYSFNNTNYKLLSFDKNELNNKINNLVDGFYEYVTNRNGNKIFTQQKAVQKKGVFLKGVELFAGASIEFYETWNSKASYLILYLGTEPVLELQLTRILFHNDNTITWYLRNPSKPNKMLYNTQGLNLITLPNVVVEQIKQQQKAYDGNNYDSDNGRQVYEFVVNSSPDIAFAKLFSLLIKGAIGITEMKPQPKPEKKEVPASYEYPTDSILREIAIQNADYKCEYDNSHISFTCKATNKQYMEGHHLIPMGKQDEFSNKLDIPINIFSLCPNCHKAVHYGIFEEKKPILEKLFMTRKAGLQMSVPEINFEKLLSLYS